MTRADLLDRIEPALAWAREAATAHDEARARAVIAACADYLVLYRQARYEEYQPALVLEPLYNELRQRTDVEVDFETTPPAVGDPEQVLIAARAALLGVELQADARVVAELFHESDITRLDLNLDGPGRFDDLWFGGMVRMSRDELAERWTYATRGGRIDATPNGFSLRITGVRKPPSPIDDVEPLVHVLRVPGTIRESVDTALHVIDGAPAPPSPADLSSLIDSVVAEEREALGAKQVSVQTLVEPDLPAVPMRRSRLRMFFQSLLRWACASLPQGGTVTFLCDYDSTDRVIGLVATVAGRDAQFDDHGYASSIRRAIVEAHGGAVEIEAHGHELTIAATLPDPVGRALERWIPGFERFSPRSQRMLRLLKSGGPTPPEDFLLSGILEEELEAWLLPRLQVPLAVNIAGETPAKDAGRHGASIERLRKALQQIQKGKVKKEIAQPPYAAEIIWVFRTDDRRRAALGLERLTPDEIESLAGHLWANPPRYPEALRLLAIRNWSQGEIGG